MANESLQETLYLPVIIENINVIEIPDDVSISVSAVVSNDNSNATQGIIIQFTFHFQSNPLSLLLFYTSGSDYTTRTQNLVFYHDSPSTGLNILFNIIPDTLVEGNEVIEFVFSEVVIYNLNNTNAASVDQGSYRKTVVTIADDDGEMCRSTLLHIHIIHTLLCVSDLRVGFTQESSLAEEGDQIKVCARILNGTLGSGLSLHYRIRAPHENSDFPGGKEDSAKCMFYSTDSCAVKSHFDSIK